MPHPRDLARLCAWLVFILWLIATPLRAQEPAHTLTLAQYRAELANAIQELEMKPDDGVEATLEQLQKHFASITHVTYGGEHTVTVTSILDGLNAAAEAASPSEESSVDAPQSSDAKVSSLGPKDAALARLRGAAMQIDGSVNDNTSTRLAVLQTILARPEFNTPMSLWDRFWQWLQNLLSQWWPDSTPSNSGGLLAWLVRAVPWVVSIIIVAVVIWLLSYWLQRLLRSFVRDARIDELAGDDDLPRTAAEARQQARAAAQSGLYRDAVRRLYLAALLQLSELNLITFERSLTNREVLTSVSANSPIRPHLEPVVATFDQVWYGVREPDQETFNAYEQEIDRLAVVAKEAAALPAGRGEA